ncbi:Golgin subfamily A member 7/ERF4 [Macrophomina phaseolina MS6]|uniref:Ras modification protein ERF4 n=1 Tax=Macrophomina phaseolina (strain MS6) TaxID=1126212 RepID=K2RU14_MACPH|nr:Golgin subfamily A member 7/ERF4 [Macrophomina phaseolina MS6]
MIAGDLAPTFANLYPEVLDPLISEDQFRNIIKKINAELQAAFNPYSTRAWVDAVMGAATLWLWEDLGLTGVKKTLKALEDWIEEWNRTEGVKEGVKLIPLRRTGYLTVRYGGFAGPVIFFVVFVLMMAQLDIQIPDPHIGLEQSTASIRSGLVSPTADADGPPQLPHPTGIKV